jgi:hypothetical protein
MCMASVNGRDSPYVFISKVYYYIMGAHLLCTNYIDSFLLKFKILNQVPIVHIIVLWHINSLHLIKNRKGTQKLSHYSLHSPYCQLLTIV